MRRQAPEFVSAERLIEWQGQARNLINRGEFSDAATLYRRMLSSPDLDQWIDARAEASDILGALLLHDVCIDADPLADTDANLDEAIDLLRFAGAAQGDAMRNAVTLTNLAHAYFQRHGRTSQQSDLMSANLELDKAEALAQTTRDPELVQWIASIRRSFIRAGNAAD